MLIELLEMRLLFSSWYATSDTSKTITAKSNTAYHFQNYMEGGILIWGVHNVSVDGFKITSNAGYGVFIGGGADNIRVMNGSVSGCGRAGIGVYGASNAYIGYVDASNNPGIANFAKPSGSGIEIGYGAGVTVDHCTASYNGAKNTSSSGPFGIWCYESSNVTFSNNESHHNTSSGGDGGGLDFDGGTTNSRMYGNYSHDNAGTGLACFQYSGASKWSSNTITGNRSINDGLKRGAGIQLWSGGTAIDAATITNNVVIGKLPFWKSGTITGLVFSGNVLTVSK